MYFFIYYKLGARQLKDHKLVYFVPSAMERYLPNYRMDSTKPFNREMCEIILKQIVDKAMAKYKYKAEECDELCSKLCEDIKAAVKKHKFDRWGLRAMGIF